MKPTILSKDHKVLLIIHDVYQDDNVFPLGAAYLAGALRDAGASVEVYCMDLYHFTNEDLAKKLQNERYDLIGVGFMAARFKETILALCEVINANKKDAWLVLGGHGPTPIPDYVLETTRADVVAMGEAEATIVEVLCCKVNKGERSRVDGIAYRDGDEIFINKRRRLLYNLDELPVPARDLFPIADYAQQIKWPGQEKGEISLNFDTARGCVARCEFCYRMEKGIRRKSLPRVAEEIKDLYLNHNINNFYINDELFVSQKKRVFEFEQVLAESGLEIKFGCDARVDLLDVEVLSSLKRAGCQVLCIGFESTDDHVLQLMNKDTTVAQNIWALENIAKVGGISPSLNFIWNNPGDSEKSLRDNAKVIQKYNTYHQARTIRPITAYPGSPLYYKAIEQGLLKGPGDFFDRFVNSDLITTNFMDIPTERCYELLLEVNGELLRDHFRHTNGDLAEAECMIQQFADLYSGKNNNFRGSRHYDNEGSDGTIDYCPPRPALPLRWE